MIEIRMQDAPASEPVGAPQEPTPAEPAGGDNSGAPQA